MSMEMELPEGMAYEGTGIIAQGRGKLYVVFARLSYCSACFQLFNNIAVHARNRE